MARPRLLDTFCKAGGAGMGYYRAGFDVVGVDIEPQPRYPFPFIQAEAVQYIREHGHEYDAIHASPPCQLHSALRRCRPGFAWEEKYQDLIPQTREALEAIGVPWIIENVPGAPLRRPVTLCGTMFGLRVYRHRLFELSWPARHMFGLYHPRHEWRTTGGAKDTASLPHFITAAGHMGSSAAFRDAMGIDWNMTRGEAANAIPPAYTEYLGRQLLLYMEEAA